VRTLEEQAGSSGMPRDPAARECARVGSRREPRNRSGWTVFNSSRTGACFTAPPYRVSSTVIDSAGRVMPEAIALADVVPVTTSDCAAFWVPAL
jgi:hypothetical protein